MPQRHIEDEATRATAHLPGLDIEVVHRRAPSGEAEQLSINIQALPSFEAFGRFVERSNPFAFWISGSSDSVASLAGSHASNAATGPDNSASEARPGKSGLNVRPLHLQIDLGRACQPSSRRPQVSFAS